MSSPSGPGGNGRVLVGDSVYRVCLAHALMTEREEVMGLLLGDECDGEVRIWASKTLQRSDKRPDRCEISPEELVEGSIAAERLSQGVFPRTRVMGWYHSHPHITMFPSHVDLGTQAQYQSMEASFVGLIFAVFNTNSSTGVMPHPLMAFRAVGARGGQLRCAELQVDVVPMAQIIDCSISAIADGGNGFPSEMGGCLGKRALLETAKQNYVEMQTRYVEVLQELEGSSAPLSRTAAGLAYAQQLSDFMMFELAPLAQYCEIASKNAEVMAEIHKKQAQDAERFQRMEVDAEVKVREALKNPAAKPPKMSLEEGGGGAVISVETKPAKAVSVAASISGPDAPVDSDAPTEVDSPGTAGAAALAPSDAQPPSPLEGPDSGACKSTAVIASEPQQPNSASAQSARIRPQPEQEQKRRPQQELQQEPKQARQEKQPQRPQQLQLQLGLPPQPKKRARLKRMRNSIDSDSDVGDTAFAAASSSSGSAAVARPNLKAEFLQCNAMLQCGKRCPNKVKDKGCCGKHLQAGEPCAPYGFADASSLILGLSLPPPATPARASSNASTTSGNVQQFENLGKIVNDNDRRLHIVTPFKDAGRAEAHPDSQGGQAPTQEFPYEHDKTEEGVSDMAFSYLMGMKYEDLIGQPATASTSKPKGEGNGKITGKTPTGSASSQTAAGNRTSAASSSAVAATKAAATSGSCIEVEASSPPRAADDRPPKEGAKRVRQYKYSV